MRRVAWFVACLMPGLSSGSPIPEEAPHPTSLPAMTDAQFQAALRVIDRKTEELRKARHVPGLSMVIVKDDKVVWLKGYGYRNVEKKLPMTPDTITMIASCSKAFTSTLALMAVQEGKLSLDDPVAKYVPYFKLKDAEADGQITVADLMCHSSGLPRTDQAWTLEHLSAEECIKLLAKCEPTFKFRENAQYSNVLVNTASVATSNAYGEPWSQLLKEKIVEPLHMDSTSTADPTTLNPARMSIGYWFNPLTRSVERERYLDAPFIEGAGTVKSTARDLGNWLRFHLGEGTFEGHKILDSAILAEAYKPRQQIGDGFAFGLGWVNEEDYAEPVIQHGGDLPGFQSLVCLVPSRHLGIAFSDNNDDAGLRAPLLRMILTNLIGKPDKAWNDQRNKEPGLFVDPSASHLLRIYNDGSLWALLDQDPAIRLTRIGWRTYVTADHRNPLLRVTFQADKTAKGSKTPEVHIESDGKETVYRAKAAFDPGVTTDALMKRVVDVYGGADNLSKPLRVTARYDGDLPQEGLHAEGLLVRAGGDVGYMEQLYDGHRYLGTTHNGVNQKSGGGTESNYRYFPTLGPDLVDAQLDAEVCQSFNWKSKFKSAEIIVRQQLDGEPVYVVKKTPIDSDDDVLEFISEKSGLVLRREWGSPPNVTIFGDYRPVQGVMLPYHMTTIDPSFHREEIAISDYKPSDRYLHWAFNPKGSAKPPQ